MLYLLKSTFIKLGYSVSMIGIIGLTIPISELPVNTGLLDKYRTPSRVIKFCFNLLNSCSIKFGLGFQKGFSLK